MTRRIRIPDWVLLAAVCAFFCFWKLYAFGLIGADEPRYAQVAREMLERHDWITPTLGGVPWLEKPPLYYWQATIAYRLFGVSDWAARLPSVCDALLLVFGVYWILRRFRPGLELDGALMAAASAGLVGYARAASMDMPLTATFAIAMLTWFVWFESSDKEYLIAFWVFLALATLAKGPVALFLAAVILALFALLEKRAHVLIGSLWLPGIVLFLIVAAPWYVAVQLRNPQFFRVFILEHNLARFGTNLYHHPEPFWYYVPVTFLGWMPWSVLMITAVIWSLRRIRSAEADALGALLVTWIAVVGVFFSISQSKLPGYVLPAIPAGSILAALWMRERVQPSPVIAALHALCAAVLIFPALMVRYIFLDRHELWERAAVVPLIATVVLAIIITLLVWRRSWKMVRVATLFPAIVVVAIVLRLGAVPINDKLSARSVVDALSQYDERHVPVATYLVPRETEFGLAFYRNQIIPRYEVGQVPDGEHLLVAAQGYSKGMARAAGRTVVFLENFAPQKLDLFYVPAK